MEDDFPRSVAEAQEHIRLIRREKGLGDGPEQIGNNAADLESALKVLSNDLYQTATHFLLELIQNADDNFYTVEVPTLSISYSKGRVRIDCNERGFSKKNIEAICRICKSTKSGNSKSAGFVGEKGIGFKAVFKVASTVWISSGHYSFRFDRDAHLGMIAPIWDKFPEKPKEGCTSIYLKLAKDCDERHIIDELRLFDEKILIFLRRLRRLEIDVKSGPIALRKPIITKPFETILSRQGGSSEQASDMVLMNNGVKKHYFVWRHLAKRMPKDSRRPGISKSEVVLVFPHTGPNEHQVRPIIQEQSVYAFLPIRKAGFNFLLQADFLLSANREDVHVDSAWNKSLASAVAVAYVNAMVHLGNFPKGLGHTWPSYIPSVTGKTPFFEDMRQDILKRLKKADVVKSQAGSKTKPEKVVQVPWYMIDPDGNPFMISDKNKKGLLASGYDPVAYGYGLDVLGVRSMDNNTFYKEMALVLKGREEEFLASQSKEWHAAFARALSKMGYTPGTALIPIIPLQNGKWVNTSTGVFFPESQSTLPVPKGIQILTVDREAAADPDRRALFSKTGVQDLTDNHINTKIKNTHADNTFDPNSLAPEVLVSHARFLFKMNPRETPMSLWMAATEGPCRRAEVMYISSDISGAASSVLPRSASASYGFLHPAYLEADGDPLWDNYLRNVLKIRIYPRIHITSTGWGPADKDTVHADFNLIMRQLPHQKWLAVLRDGWEFYKEWLEPETTPQSHKRVFKLLEYMKDYKVPCTGGIGLERFRNIYMPLERLTRDYGDLAPFLEIPDPLNPLWKPLMTALGVRTRDDVDFYLHCLTSAKRKQGVSGERIRQIMHEIEDGVEVEPHSVNFVR
ncbi:uncharacterized protein DNG_01495 [Cephalotrichum gorgonifer]|uniref:Uncharacterized protein n=1 Tax=Cephalotrichum gorgonifer TaxID=2041049 RepID=A0AAE8SSC3_9PEZI|nr:uncharacterized protein DNG_01495 [Cephalotrichum gorgonifer]